MPEDSTDETASSLAIEPASEQSDPVGLQDEGSVPPETKDDTTQFVAKGEVPVTASGSEASSISIEPAPEQSESVSDQDEGSVSSESKDNTTQLVATDETHPPAPDPEESESVGNQDEGPVVQESPENSPQLVAEDETRATAPGPEVPSISVEPVSEEGEPDSGQDEGPLPIEMQGLYRRVNRKRRDGRECDRSQGVLCTGYFRSQSEPVRRHGIGRAIHSGTLSAGGAANCRQTPGYAGRRCGPGDVSIDIGAHAGAPWCVPRY